MLKLLSGAFIWKILSGEFNSVNNDLEFSELPQKVSKAQRLFCQLGQPEAEVAHFPGVTASAVVRAAKTQELKEVQKYL